MTDPSGLRRLYARGSLDDADVADTWLDQLTAWFDEAVADPSVLEANAIQLATVDADGAPSVRTVLVKSLDERGIVFYTNYESAKGRDLAAAPRAAAVFAWLAHERQVRLAGPVRPVERAETETYFATRPRESQLGAWASPQSQVVASRDELDQQYAAAEQRFGDGPIPAPPHWGGYLLEPESVEFWQGRTGRLHDRIRFRRDGGHGGTSDWPRDRHRDRGTRTGRADRRHPRHSQTSGRRHPAVGDPGLQAVADRSGHVVHRLDADPGRGAGTDLRAHQIIALRRLLRPGRPAADHRVRALRRRAIADVVDRGHALLLVVDRHLGGDPRPVGPDAARSRQRMADPGPRGRAVRRVRDLVVGPRRDHPRASSPRISSRPPTP